MNTTTKHRLTCRDRIDSKITLELAWTTRYSKSILIGAVKTCLETSLHAVADREALQLIYMQVNDSSVHMRLRAPAHIAPSLIMSRLKAASHRALIDAFPDLHTRVKSVWTVAGYIRTTNTSTPGGAEDWLLTQRGLSKDAVQRRRIVDSHA